MATLLKIVEAIQKTEMRLWLLDSQTLTHRPEILERFIEDCWTALVTFRRVCGRLAGIIESDGWNNPSETASETLEQIMQLLETFPDQHWPCLLYAWRIPHFAYNSRPASSLNRLPAILESCSAKVEQWTSFCARRWR